VDKTVMVCAYPQRWWADLVGAPQVQPHKHSADHPEKKDRGVPGDSVSRELFWPQLMKVPIVSSLRPSQDVAETLSRSLRVSELVSAVAGALLPSCWSIEVDGEGKVPSREVD
jgi:hypothetical protein